MKVLLAGRLAEEVVFGRVTTGASDDLRRVTEISRSMIEDYGMGSQLIACGNGSSGESLSEATRGQRDREQQALVDEAQWESRCLIVDHRELLDKFAHSLLANESLDRGEIDKIMESAPPTRTQREEAQAKSSEVHSSNGAAAERDVAADTVAAAQGHRFTRDSRPRTPAG
jgi:cell division protease FtsH